VDKRCFRDIVAIKRRLRGLTADFYKTQKIVLANSAKVRVGSEKKLGMGLGSKDLIDLGGY